MHMVESATTTNVLTMSLSHGEDTEEKYSPESATTKNVPADPRLEEDVVLDTSPRPEPVSEKGPLSKARPGLVSINTYHQITVSKKNWVAGLRSELSRDNSVEVDWMDEDIAGD